MHRQRVSVFVYWINLLDFTPRGATALMFPLEDHIVGRAVLFNIAFSNYVGERSRTEPIT